MTDALIKIAIITAAMLSAVFLGYAIVGDKPVSYPTFLGVLVAFSVAHGLKGK